MNKADCDILRGVREILARMAALEMGLAMLTERIERLEVDHADGTGEWLGPTYGTVIVEGPITTERMTPAEMDGVHKYLARKYGIDL